MYKYLKNSLAVAMMFMALMTCFTMTSCSDDDDDNSGSIVGTWRYDFNDNGGYQLLTFDNNGNYTLVEYDNHGGDWAEHGTYSVNGNIMTRVLSDGDVEVYTILTNASNKLILRYEGEYVGQYDTYYDDDIETWTRVK